MTDKKRENTAPGGAGQATAVATMATIDPPGPEGHRERLREKFLSSGISSLHDYEVLELLLTYAIPRRDVKPVAKGLIKRFGSVRSTLDASIEDLTSVAGVGSHTASLIHLAKGLMTLYLKEELTGREVLSAPAKVLDFLNVTLAGERVEKFIALYLNSKNELLSVVTLHEGTINQTVVYPRKVIEEAFRHNARSVIFVHNHPSGDPKPSRADRHLTDDLVRAAKAVDIIVHDHIIIGRNSHFSAKDGGWLPA